MNMIKYLNSLYEVGAGLHTSKCINSKCTSLLVIDNGKGNLVCLANLHTSQLTHLFEEKFKKII